MGPDLVIYRRYAEAYDASGQLHFSLRMADYLAVLLPRHAWSGKSVLDLACGTGTLALYFARLGLDVHAVDASAEMLARAGAKAEAEGLAVDFCQQDMRELDLAVSFDLVTCVYDSLNYLLDTSDLERTFRRVAAVLQPGGLFLFDVNTVWSYENTHPGTHFSEGEGVAVITQGTYDHRARLATTDIVGFIGRGACYERFHEVHAQRAHLPEEIERGLATAGLRVQARYECFGFDPPTAESPRVMWVAARA
jgi:SAM-dependent methyltransferase